MNPAPPPTRVQRFAAAATLALYIGVSTVVLGWIVWWWVEAAMGIVRLAGYP